MATQNRTVLKSYFNTGDTPTEAQFANLIDSFPNLTESSVTNTQFGYLSGVTSSIQTQLNAKMADLVDDTTPQLGGDLDTNGNAITGDTSARLYRPQSENSLTVDTNLSNLTENTTILINASASNVTITVDDAASALPIGTTFEFIQRIGSNDVIFAASGSQSILSADDNLKIRTRFAGAILTKQLNNSWYLIGDLKA